MNGGGIVFPKTCMIYRIVYTNLSFSSLSQCGIDISSILGV